MSSKPSISPEDRDIFRDAMQDVIPLRHQKPTHRGKTPFTQPTQTKTHVDYSLSDYYADPIHAESILSHHRPGVCAKQIHMLKSGKVTYTARLDLHGLKPDAAKERLSHFIHHQIQAQHRWVLVIHGKGGRFGEAPVLKNLVNHWLRQIPDVLAFHSAVPRHGGAGAVYVLLPRPRQ